MRAVYAVSRFTASGDCPLSLRPSIARPQKPGVSLVFLLHPCYGVSTSKAYSSNDGSPFWRPYMNHRTRCSLVPCVNFSGWM